MERLEGRVSSFRVLGRCGVGVTASVRGEVGVVRVVMESLEAACG